ncbi:unnamed protein product [Acanthoscelides obtectus]|uniref:Uncharacterized protein n=1 Tax=Acanthoscelides obtectus TaxID=200917 RepID=A0A9P0LNZ5_ACAOB|nr:unnamed protein product [Acanthoscelides obtectus]CAK1624480.1 hypothetical protein AOBTE_LOCUS2576 [Acanthoscelides obtectus]
MLVKSALSDLHAQVLCVEDDAATSGVLKNRFRCLLKDRVLHYAPFRAGQIINATSVLHNMCVGLIWIWKIKKRSKMIMMFQSRMLL